MVYGNLDYLIVYSVIAHTDTFKGIFIISSANKKIVISNLGD